MNHCNHDRITVYGFPYHKLGALFGPGSEKYLFENPYLIIYGEH